MVLLCGRDGLRLVPLDLHDQVGLVVPVPVRLGTLHEVGETLAAPLVHVRPERPRSMAHLADDLDHFSDHLATAPLLDDAITNLGLAQVVVFGILGVARVVTLVHGEDVGARVTDTYATTPRLRHLDVAGKGKPKAALRCADQRDPRASADSREDDSPSFRHFGHVGSGCCRTNPAQAFPTVF